MPLAPGTTVTTLDPALQLDSSANGVLQLIWPTLVTLDSSAEPRPWAAKSIDISPDGLTYTFHLYPGSPLAMERRWTRKLLPTRSIGSSIHVPALALDTIYTRSRMPMRSTVRPARNRQWHASDLWLHKDAA